MALGDFDSRWKNPQSKTLDNLYLWAQDLIKELRKGEYIANSIEDGIANDQLADMDPWTIKLRNAATAGDGQDVTINGLTEETSIDGSADFQMLWDTGSGVMRKNKPLNVTRTGGWQLLTASSVSSQANLSIVLTSYTAYRAIRVVLTSFLPATDDVELWMRFSTDGGSNYDATGYRWANMLLADNSATAINQVSAASNQLTIAGHSTASASVSNVANEGGVDADILICNQTAARYTRGLYKAGYFSASGVVVTVSGSGVRANAQDTDAVRFLFESGDIASGNYAVYGLA